MNVPTSTWNAQKRTGKADFIALVEATIDEANHAAKAAFDAYVRATPGAADGRDGGGCGYSTLILRHASPRLRKALVEMGEVRRVLSDRGEWAVGSFHEVAPTQSYSANYEVREAAREVFARKLSDDGSFSVKSWVD